jgi:cobalt-zinc-cadmium resistance protein CzcA
VHRAKAVAVAVSFASVIGVASTRLGTEFLPELDEGDLNVFVEMPPSIAMAEGQQILLEVRERLLEFPEVSQVLSEHGRPEDGTDNEAVNMSETFVQLAPREEWRSGWDTARLIEAMRESLVQIPGVQFNFSQPIKDNVEESLTGVRGKVVVKIFGSDLLAMRSTLTHAKQVLSEIPGVVDVDLYREASVPQLRVDFDRDALARMGLSIDDAQTVLETALAGRIATEIWEGEVPVPVRVVFPAGVRSDVEAIRQISVPAHGAQVPFERVARIEIVEGVASINREGGSRYLAMKFNVEGRDLGSTISDAIAAIEGEVEPPENHYFVWGGEFENQERAVARLRVAVPVAVLLVLALLYAALQSGRSAVAILAVVPFGATGAVVALLVSGIPLSVSAAVGFIALLGQVALMGVLVLSAAAERRASGEEFELAIARGCAERLRPVLMASLLALAGLLPMAVASGVGSETQRPFALVVVGGMVTTAAAALLLLPIVYSYLARRDLLTPEQLDEQ